MALNWSTFALEIINFLVLVWLLKHFLYQPVLRIVEKRRQQIDAKLLEAERLRHEAEEMKTRYERRVADWEREKKKAWETLHREMEEERQRRIAALSQELEEERRKAEVVWEQEKREWRRHLEEQALDLGAKFVARMLERLADTHLHRRLLEMLLEDLAQMPQTRVETMRRDFHSAPGEVKVISAYPLTEKETERLKSVLHELLGTGIECRFDTNPSLLAGLRIDLGAHVVRANLKDELLFFSRHG